MYATRYQHLKHNLIIETNFAVYEVNNVLNISSYPCRDSQICVVLPYLSFCFLENPLFLRQTISNDEAADEELVQYDWPDDSL